MLLDDFDYTLPPELIAQQPSDRRDDSRLMILERETGNIAEASFREISGLFRPGDLLVVNDTRVIPARLTGFKESGGRAEVFLVRKLAEPGEFWHCLIKASKPPKPATTILLPAGLRARVMERGDEGLWIVSFSPVDGFEGASGRSPTFTSMRARSVLSFGRQSQLLSRRPRELQTPAWRPPKRPALPPSSSSAGGAHVS